MKEILLALLPEKFRRTLGREAIEKDAFESAELDHVSYSTYLLEYPGSSRPARVEKTVLLQPATYIPRSAASREADGGYGELVSMPGDRESQGVIIHVFVTSEATSDLTVHNRFLRCREYRGREGDVLGMEVEERSSLRDIFHGKKVITTGQTSGNVELPAGTIIQAFYPIDHSTSSMYELEDFDKYEQTRTAGILDHLGVPMASTD